jgi:hypothetical protein
MPSLIPLAAKRESVRSSFIKRGGILVSSVSPIPRCTAERYGVRAVFFLVEVTAGKLNAIAELFERGELVPHVRSVLALEQARTAHKHHDEQLELVDSIAERIQLLGGVSIATAPDVAETTQIERPPRGRDEVPVQLSRLVEAHQVIIRQTRKLARRTSELQDDGTNDLLVSEVLRTNELQVWFLSEHLG